MSRFDDRRVGWSALSVVVLAAIAAGFSRVPAEEACPRILVQDSTLDNLVDPPGYVTAAPRTLGAVKRAGSGSGAMILVPGLGFGGSVFDDFMNRFADRYQMYAVTLAGFGGTPAPPAPGRKVSFGEQTWTNGAIEAIEKLMDREHLRDVVLVGHWIGGTQVALRLAMRHPERIRAVVLLAGAARMELSDSKFASYYETPARRIATVDTYLGPRWFKTVTRETWDDNNFMPGDYAVHPVWGLRLWRQAAAPPLHVWVRYLCEFDAQDVVPELDRLAVPTLLLEPGLENHWIDPAGDYMSNYCHRSWEGRPDKHPKMQVQKVADSRICLWIDRPEEVHRLVASFLNGIGPHSAQTR